MTSGRPENGRLRLAVIGTGISGMSAAWLLSQRHDVTVYERADRIGGHSHTVDVPTAAEPIPVDTGFIVYNEAAYPNLTALFAHLDVPTEPSDMSFAVSLDGGRLEYSGCGFSGLFAQKRNLFRPRFWSMLTDIHRFYREAPTDVTLLDELHTTLGDYLDMRSYGRAVSRRSSAADGRRDLVGAAARHARLSGGSFIRFHDNHGLLRVRQPAAMAHRHRRQPCLCRTVDRFLSRPDRTRHRREARAARPATGSASGTPPGGCNGSTMS